MIILNIKKKDGERIRNFCMKEKHHSEQNVYVPVVHCNKSTIIHQTTLHLLLTMKIEISMIIIKLGKEEQGKIVVLFIVLTMNKHIQTLKESQQSQQKYLITTWQK